MNSIAQQQRNRELNDFFTSDSYAHIDMPDEELTLHNFIAAYRTLVPRTAGGMSALGYIFGQWLKNAATDDEVATVLKAVHEHGYVSIDGRSTTKGSK